MKAQVNFDALGGGGSTDYVSGTETLNTSTDTVVTLDFVPSKIIVESANTQANNDIRCSVWDSELNSGANIYQLANTGGTFYTYSMPYNNSSDAGQYGQLYNVNPTNKQFTIRHLTSGAVGTSVTWIAFK